MSLFGWCQSGEHNDCVTKYQKFYIGIIGKGRKKTEGVIMLDEFEECSCQCHQPEPVKKKKTRTVNTKEKLL